MQGLLLLNKPKGITSFKAVTEIKRLTGQKRAGHTGTLDPMACGVLPILLGKATALSGLLLDSDKRYTAAVRLGTTTDTDDITGNIISQNRVDVTCERLADALSAFTGKIMQRPPMYSALKKNGVRLYELARRGETVDIAEREVEIFSLNLLSGPDANNVFEVDTRVSKGTYIRSLARDLGEYLGCGACLDSLCRTYAGGFPLSRCVSLERLSSENIGGYIINEEEAVRRLREVCVTFRQAVRFCNGGQLSFDRIDLGKPENGELFRVKHSGRFLGIGTADCENSCLAVRCIINYPEGSD